MCFADRSAKAHNILLNISGILTRRKAYEPALEMHENYIERRFPEGKGELKKTVAEWEQSRAVRSRKEFVRRGRELVGLHQRLLRERGRVS